MSNVDHPVGEPLSQPLNSLLRMAVLAGVETAVRLHVRRGDDLNARDGNGMTPLMLAASKNKGSICSLLLSSGADPALTDPGGRDALTLARVMGAPSAVAVLEPFEHNLVNEATANHITILEVESSVCSNVDAPKAVSPQPIALDEDGDPFDLSDWEAEEDGPAPKDNGELLEAARVVYGVISTHVLIDSSEDWGDVEAFLPEGAVPLPRVGDEDGRKGILQVLRRALREGSVPDLDIATLSENDDGSQNEATEALLRLVLGEMGAETDERIEPEGVECGWDECEADEDDVSAALTFLEETKSGRNEPMRLYARDIRAERLLTADEETTLGKDMEEGISSALDILASWPGGFAALLSTSERVRLGEIGAEFITDGRGGEGEDPATQDVPNTPDDIEDQDEGDLLLSAAARELLDRIGAIKALAGSDEPSDREALRLGLVTANLSPPFLAWLADNSIKDTSAEATRYRLAIARYSSARKRMIVSNLRLVISVVKRYQNLGLTFEDLVQEGNIGLMKAVDRYDWRRGFRFSTYATWWIRQQATRAVADMGKTIRTPVHVHDTMLKIRREAEESEHDMGHTPTIDVLARKLSMPPRKISALMARMEEPIPLHLPDSSGTVPGDCLVDDSPYANPAVLTERGALISTLEKMLAELGHREADVLILRFGLKDEDPHTLEETGMRYGVTRERIRQIEASALRKLANPIRSHILRDFMGSSKHKPCKTDDDVNAEVESPPSACSSGSEGIDGERMEKVIGRLRVCGAEVVDGRSSGGQIVVRNLRNDPQTKTLVHALLEAGFRPYPGMEFRK